MERETGSSLEGWAPEIPDAETLHRVVDLAFDYRGDVTVETVEGLRLTGYLFNRNRDGVSPFVELLLEEGGPPHRVPCDRIHRIRFSGKDTAVGGSYAAWLRRKETQIGNGAPESGARTEAGVE